MQTQGTWGVKEERSQEDPQRSPFPNLAPHQPPSLPFSFGVSSYHLHQKALLTAPAELNCLLWPCHLFPKRRKEDVRLLGSEDSDLTTSSSPLLG